MKKPPSSRLVAMGSPLTLSNSFISVVMNDNARIPRYPKIKHMMLEIKARMNHKVKEKINSDSIIN